MDAFYYLIQPQLEKLKEPAYDCLETIHNNIERLSSKLLAKHASRFPELMHDIEDKLQKLFMD